MLKPLYIPYHSFIDVITNSSTEIFVSCHGKTKETLFALINSLLAVAESDKKAEDLFDIKMSRDYVYDDETEEELEDVKIAFNEKGERTDNYEDDEYEDHTLVLIPKDSSKETIELTKQISTIFSLNAQYN